MELTPFLVAFFLGLSASPSCLSLCLPVMVPMISANRDSSPRGGLLFSAYLASGRLMVYVGLAALAGFLGSLVLDPEEGLLGWDVLPRVVMVLVAVGVMVYSVCLLKGWLSPLSCPRRFLPSAPKNRDPGLETGTGEGKEIATRPAPGSGEEGQKARLVPLLLGFLFGSMLCPAFLLLLGTTLVADGLLTAAVAGFLFWLGTLPLNLLAGAASGEFGRRWRRDEEKSPRSFVTNVSAMTLFMVGLWWLLLALL